MKSKMIVALVCAGVLLGISYSGHESLNANIIHYATQYRPLPVKKTEPQFIDSIITAVTEQLSPDSILLVYGASAYAIGSKQLAVIMKDSLSVHIPPGVDYIIEAPADSSYGLPLAFEYGNEESGKITPFYDTIYHDRKVGMEVRGYYGYTSN